MDFEIIDIYRKKLNYKHKNIKFASNLSLSIKNIEIEGQIHIFYQKNYR